ncbi:MAG: hypothetical protein P0S94_05660, partial [Simkaniaceae bacterium]|nr:hypothetical protein [Simkaniaceae bacterium]
VISDVEMPSLFGGNGWIAVENVKGKLDAFTLFPNVVLLGSLGSGKGLFTIDYSKEKPWDRKGRMVKWAIDYAVKFGKKFEPPAAAHLVEIVEGEMALLYQEIEKLVAFVGSNDVIDHGAVKAICIKGGGANLWKLSEAIVFDGQAAEMPQFYDVSALHAFLGQLKYHFSIGKKMSLLSQLDQSLFPTMRPKQSAMFFDKAQKRGYAHFKEGIKALFDMELKLKTTSVDPDALFTHFYAKVTT